MPLKITKSEEVMESLREMIPYEKDAGYANRLYEENHNVLSNSFWNSWKRRWGTDIKPTDVIARNIISKQAITTSKAYNLFKKDGIIVASCEKMNDEIDMLTFERGKIEMDDFLRHGKKLDRTIRQCVDDLLHKV